MTPEERAVIERARAFVDLWHSDRADDALDIEIGGAAAVLRAALDRLESPLQPQRGDYPEEGPVPTSVQNVWNERAPAVTCQLCAIHLQADQTEPVRDSRLTRDLEAEFEAAPSEPQP